MRNAGLAELLLSFVTTRDHAASMVGDFLEDAGGPWRFWLRAVLTGFAQFCRQMKTAPLAMAGSTVFIMSIELGLIVVWGLAAMLWVDADPDSPAIFHANLPWLPAVITFLWVPLMTGTMFRRHPGREAAGIATLSVLHAAITLAVGLSCWLKNAHFDIILGVPLINLNGDLFHTLRFVAFYLTVYPIVLLTGAALVRDQWVKWIWWPLSYPR